jgi:hypothetical protein
VEISREMVLNFGDVIVDDTSSSPSFKELLILPYRRVSCHVGRRPLDSSGLEVFASS